MVQVPIPFDQASQAAHKFTLTNDDSSYSQTLTLASDAQAGTADGTSLLVFKDMTENHTYTLQCDDGANPAYPVFQAVDYDSIVQKFAANGQGPSSSQPPGSQPPASQPPASQPPASQPPAQPQ